MEENIHKKILESIDATIIFYNKNNEVLYTNKENDFLKKLYYIGNNIYKDTESLKYYQKETKTIDDGSYIDTYFDVTELKKEIARYGIDALTKIPIRGKIDEYLGIVKNSRFDYMFAMIDIDNFKHVNDTYGHQTGDVVLKEIAHILYKNKRTEDFVGRYGGEEFFMSFRTSDKEKIVLKLDEIRSQVESKVFQVKENLFNVTISIGTSLFRKGDNTSAKVDEADKALYYVKENGKNAVATYSEIEHEYVKCLKK